MNLPARRPAAAPPADAAARLVEFIKLCQRCHLRTLAPGLERWNEACVGVQTSGLVSTPLVACWRSAVPNANWRDARAPWTSSKWDA